MRLYDIIEIGNPSDPLEERRAPYVKYTVGMRVRRRCPIDKKGKWNVAEHVGAILISDVSQT